jgi:hypothetical protein
MSYYYPYKKNKACSAYPPAESSPVKRKYGNVLWNDLTVRCCWEKEHNIRVTTGNNDNWLRVGRRYFGSLPKKIKYTVLPSLTTASQDS